MTFTQIYRYPTGGQVTNTKYDIPFTAELVKEWGPKWKVKDEKQYQEKHQQLERGFVKIIKQDQELSKRGIVDYEIFNKKYEELAKQDSKVIFGGRLGQYKYYDMHKVIEEALNCVKNDFN